MRLFSALSWPALLMLLHPGLIFGIQHQSFVLDNDFDLHTWRRLAGKSEEPQINKRVVWTLHDLVGIGNALGGFSRALQDSLAEDRLLIINSIILQKFCHIVGCPLRQVATNG